MHEEAALQPDGFGRKLMTSAARNETELVRVWSFALSSTSMI
jgi:hypothetical protein